ncbi:hypothetical protein ACFYO5_11310 [Streptomyces sp. NPDC006259]|uniref:hypothetical protein n=1 Tax=Streptomyces sp. NPDC006259 TaxID=3364740 RepID=UPI00368AEDBB
MAPPGTPSPWAGPLAGPVALVSFAAATDIVLAARVQLSGAETMDDRDAPHPDLRPVLEHALHRP